MKNFISKNWKNILIAIGVIFIVIDLIYIIIIPATIQEDFLEYGPNIESDIFDGASTITNELNNVQPSGEMISNVSTTFGIPSDLAKGLIFLVGGILALLVLSAIMDKDSGGAKKKK